MEEALLPLEQLELEIGKAERPPFEKWYRETWIRRRLSPYNVHRSYEQLRAFIASEGTEKLQPPKYIHLRRGKGLEEDKNRARFLDSTDKLLNEM